MKIPRFCVEENEIHLDEIVLNDKESRHASKVLRIKTGSPVECFDAKGHARCGTVTGLEKGRLRITMNQAEKLLNPSPANRTLITLALSVIKPERMDAMIQASSALGAAEIIPILSARCVVKLSAQRWAAKLERWRRIALEACKQCGRNEPTRIRALQTFRVFVESWRDWDCVLIPTLEVETRSLHSVLSDASPKKILSLIGPEGDFTQDEVRQAVAKGAQPVSLGPEVLRSETAALYLLSVLRYHSSQVPGGLND